ncbi:unnamed protein product [Cylicocyclus nassatus]|uniref:Uncharacterized protein n=1 Tax=Cylicocyclus nassatus TaxID=53992 RepID=A0AA36MDB4_CYLNA|nr:unnamed protein product [Cylicocyclus nassatus]
MTAASLTNIVLGCLTTLFIFQIAFYYYQNTQKEAYHTEWISSKDQCLCESKANCYPLSADSSQCGRCFSCISIAPVHRKRDAGMAFALSSDHTAMGKVLVLIASIHKFYPSTKVLLYDRLDEKDSLLQKQLVSIRNIQVLPSNIATKYLAPDAHNSQMNIFFMLDALSRYESILWLTDDLEILSKSLDDALNKSTSSIMTIGREYTISAKRNAYASYFPGTAASSNNYTLLLLRDGSQKTLQW